MAQWIWCSSSTADNQWGCFHKTVSLSAVPARAVADIAVDSKYWLWVNGTLAVREGGLKRGPTPNDTYFDRVDLAPYLKEGTNVIAALVWYWGNNDGCHRSSGCPGFYFSAPQLPLYSDASWAAAPHPAFLETDGAIFNHVRVLPEWNILFDANRDIDGWFAREQVDWNGAVELGEAPCAPWNQLVERPIPQWLDSQLLPYQSIHPKPDGPLTRDTEVTAVIGTNVQCYPYFKIKANGGERIECHAERDWRRNVYIARPGVQEFECPAWGNGHYVTYSFPKGVEIISLHFRQTGYNTRIVNPFHSPNPQVQALWDKSLRATYVNMRDHFTDCPDRERQQWPGDAASSIEQALYAFDENARSLMRKFFLETVNWRAADGALWGPVPTNRFRGSYREFPVQMFAAIHAMGVYCRHTGEVDLARRLLPHVAAYLLDVWTVDPAELLVHRGNWDTNWSTGPQGWYDWDDNIDKRLLENAWYYLALNALQQLAQAAHDESITRRTQQIKALFQSAFDGLFWNGVAYVSPGHNGPPDDRGNALAVLGGLADSSKWEVIGNVLQTSQYASIYMEKYVVEALFHMGRYQQGIRRMKERLGFELSSPWTTMGECFGEASNHGWGGWPAAIFAKYPDVIARLWT